MRKVLLALTLGILIQACIAESPPNEVSFSYFDNAGRDDVLVYATPARDI